MVSSLPHKQADEIQPEYSRDWLNKHTVSKAKNGLHLLDDGRTAIWKDDRVVFRGRWESEKIGADRKPASEPG